jgi:hypothetical protein
VAAEDSVQEVKFEIYDYQTKSYSMGLPTFHGAFTPFLMSQET